MRKKCGKPWQGKEETIRYTIIVNEMDLEVQFTDPALDGAATYEDLNVLKPH